MWQNSTETMCPLVHRAGHSVASTFLITGDVNLDCLAKVLSAWFLLRKVTDFPFVIIVYLGRGLLSVCSFLLRLPLILAWLGELNLACDSYYCEIALTVISVCPSFLLHLIVHIINSVGRFVPSPSFICYSVLNIYLDGLIDIHLNLAYSFSVWYKFPSSK